MSAAYERTIVAALEGAGGETGKGFTFLSGDGASGTFLSFARLSEDAARRAAVLRDAGLKRGDRIALVLTDAADFIPTFLGALWAGLIPVPLYPPLSLGRLETYLELVRSILTSAAPTAICATPRIRQVLWAVAPALPSLKVMLSSEELAERAATAAPIPPCPVGDEDIAFLQFTSGSTGTPRGIVITHGALRANGEALIVHGLDIREGRDSGVSWLPLYHDMGLVAFVLAPLFQYSSVTYLPTLSFLKTPALWFETLHKTGATATCAPNFAYALAARRLSSEQISRWDLSRVRVFGCGAEPINASVLRAFLDKFAPAKVKPSALTPCYGMAEATVAISINRVDARGMVTDVVDPVALEHELRAIPPADGIAGREVVGCGRATPNHALRILDAEGRPLPERQVGEIVFRGPSTARAVFRDGRIEPGITGEDGWLRTGDLGYQADGELFVVGRKKDVVIVNGRNYDPVRIEWLAEEVPGVRKGGVVAFSIPGRSTEEVVVAVETREPDKARLTAALASHIREQLGLVAQIAVLPPGALPKTSSGKIQRRQSRELFLSGALATAGDRTAGGRARPLTLARQVLRSVVGWARHTARVGLSD